MRSAVTLGVLTTLTLAGCGSVEPHHAQWNPSSVPRNEDWHSPRASLLRYDANDDGILTRAELLAGLRTEFGGYDADHNNCLSTDEVRAINQGRVQQDASRAIPLVDWNQDGCVDLREFSAANLSLFDSLDGDGNGQLTAAELVPQGQHPAGGRTGEAGREHGGHEHNNDRQ